MEKDMPDNITPRGVEIQRLVRILARNPADLDALQRLEQLKGSEQPKGSETPEPRTPEPGKHLTYKGGVFVWTGPYETKDVPKAAGFLWHGGNCRPGYAACVAKLARVWWTERDANAARIAQFADIHARKALAKHMGTVSASKAASACINVPAPKGLKYLPFQLAGIAYALGKDGVLIADQMGLGKTIQALGLVNADESIRKVLCIVPASLRLNWEREARKWLVRDFKFYVAETTALPPMEANFVILNYEKLAGKGSVAFTQFLLSLQWDFIILDECHLLKNPRAQRTRVVLGYYDKSTRTNVPGLFQQARRQVALTGTPILNRPIEAQPILGALAPEEFGNFMYFAKRYANGHYNGWGWDFRGSANLEELQERARGCCMVRRLKSDVLKELPPKVRQVICLPPNGASQIVEREHQAWERFETQLAELRDQAEEAKVSGNEDAYKAAVKELREAGQVAFNEMSDLRHQVALAKVPAVIEHLNEVLQSEEKVVLFAHHKDVVAQFEAHYSNWPPGEEDDARNVCVTLTGDTPMAKRQEAVDRFQTDPSVRVFIGNLKAAGVGLTLTASRTVVFAELDWVPANMSQAEDRCHRISQTNSVLVQHLVIDGSLDSQMAHALVEKQGIADRALDLGTRLDIECPVVPVVPKSPKATKAPKDTKSRYPVATPEQREAAGRAMQLLAGQCDGAIALDGAGFSKWDADTGLNLALVSQRGDLTDGQVWLAAKLATRYRRQLPADLLAILGTVKTAPSALT